MYAKFAQWYDFHYRSIKDYDAEVERVAYLLEKLGPKPSVILDVACGAGEHARILSERYGYAVDGIDLEPGLVEAAQLKTPSGCRNRDFIEPVVAVKDQRVLTA